VKLHFRERLARPKSHQASAFQRPRLSADEFLKSCCLAASLPCLQRRGAILSPPLNLVKRLVIFVCINLLCLLMPRLTARLR